tara:strand:- start:287 stop:667 length:381 start_codon:yes stop_codon:yes gene_type:complete
MGFFTRLARKVGSELSDLGKKAVGAVGSGLKAVGHAARVGVKYAVDHAGDIANIAGKVDKIAGVVGKAATSALPFTAEIPIVGELVGGVAAASKVVGAGARGVQRVAGAVDKGKRAVDEVRRDIGL